MWDLPRRFPLPFLALAGLGAGSVLTYLGGSPVLGRYVWFATLIGGGVPLVIQTIRRLLQGRFATDVIAMLAILGAIALDQAFAGVVIVLMQSGGGKRSTRTRSIAHPPRWKSYFGGHPASRVGDGGTPSTRSLRPRSGSGISWSFRRDLSCRSTASFAIGMPSSTIRRSLGSLCPDGMGSARRS